MGGERQESDYSRGMASKTTPGPSPELMRGAAAGPPGSIPEQRCIRCRKNEAKALLANLELEELQARLDRSEGSMGTQAQAKPVDQG